MFSSLTSSLTANLPTSLGSALSGLTGSGECPPELIDKPDDNKLADGTQILTSSKDTPYEPVIFKDKMFSYVLIDTGNPSDLAKSNKTSLWYTSIGISALFGVFAYMYSTIDD
jgi:hypothetical protein